MTTLEQLLTPQAAEILTKLRTLPMDSESTVLTISDQEVDTLAELTYDRYKEVLGQLCDMNRRSANKVRNLRKVTTKNRRKIASLEHLLFQFQQRGES